LIAIAATWAIEPAGAELRPGRALAIIAPSGLGAPSRGPVEISLVPTPALSEGEVILLSVDDDIVAVPPGSTHVSLAGIAPGTHTVDAIIVDADAQPVAAARTVTFRVDAGLWI
jgi:hypothetical protein